MKKIALLLALVACSKSGGGGDQCQQVTDKVRPVIVDMAKDKGKPLTDDDFKKMTEACRQRPKDDKKDKDMACILAAADEAGVRACFEAGLKDYSNKSKKVEAQLQLNKLGKNSKVAFITNSAFVVGKAGPLPAQPCCAQPDHHCAVTTAWAADSTWSALDFQIDEPNLFQYSYSSDGKTFTATAVGDVNCDGHPVTYTADGSVGADGNPVFKITEPPTP